MTFQFQNTPPPRKFKFRQILPICDFSVSEYPPTHRKFKFRQILHFMTFQFQNTPHRKFKFRQILPLYDFSVSEYPPPHKSEIWQGVQLRELQNTPPQPHFNLTDSPSLIGGYSATSDLDLGKKIGNLDFWDGGVFCNFGFGLREKVGNLDLGGYSATSDLDLGKSWKLDWGGILQLRIWT